MWLICSYLPSRMNYVKYCPDKIWPCDRCLELRRGREWCVWLFYLIPKTLFDFPIFWLWGYQMKVISETSRTHYVRYQRFCWTIIPVFLLLLQQLPVLPILSFYDKAKLLPWYTFISVLPPSLYVLCNNFLYQRLI
jgi:hypothetical protein